MRPGIYGREIHFSQEGSFVTLNLGINFYCEHEGGTKGTVSSINGIDVFGMISLQQYVKLVKKSKKDQKKRMKKYGVLCNYIVDPNIDCFSKELTIDNAAIRDKYTRFLFRNGKYTMYTIGGPLTSDRWNKRYGDQYVFSEEELLNMSDYSNKISICGQGHSIRKWFLRSCEKNATDNIVGSWANNGFVLYYRNDNGEGTTLINTLEEIHQRGNLAILPFCPDKCCQVSCFNGRGCWLTDVSQVDDTDIIEKLKQLELH